MVKWKFPKVAQLDLLDLVGLAGGVLVVAGLWVAWLPLGLIAAGALLVLVAVIGAD